MTAELVIATLAIAGIGMAQEAKSEHAAVGALIEPGAGTWKTWVLTSGSEFRLPPPPYGSAAREDFAELRNMIENIQPSDADRVRYWDAGPPPYRWIGMLNERLRSGRLGVSPASFRAYGLLTAAMYDATIAAWDSKYRYNRRRPRLNGRSTQPLLPEPASPSYPSEHATVAAAAASVLAYLFPAEAASFNALAGDAARSRVLAGIHYPSDAAAGLHLGRAVGRKVIEYAQADLTDSPWTGTVPTGPGLWTGTNPGFVTAPLWKPWFLTSASEFRPGPPPVFGSAQRTAELAEVKNFARTFNTNAAAFFWQTAEGVHTWFFNYVSQRLFETGLDANPPRAARAYALLGIGQFDSMIASNDGKYHYWVARPSQMDTSITTLFPPPNFPSYPANHSVLSTARCEILAYLFPDDAAFLRARGEEAGLARLWAGIHFKSDLEAGAAMGRAIAQKLIAIAENDGSKEGGL